jgi:hypothetical protein
LRTANGDRLAARFGFVRGAVGGLVPHAGCGSRSRGPGEVVGRSMAAAGARRIQAVMALDCWDSGETPLLRLKAAEC